MHRFVVLDNQNVVINAIVWDGITQYQPGEGCSVMRSETAQVGDVWNGQVFISQEPQNA